MTDLLIYKTLPVSTSTSLHSIYSSRAKGTTIILAIIFPELQTSTISAIFHEVKGQAYDVSKRRVVVLGAGGVGKSSIISRFLYNEFNQEYNPTVEDFYQAQLLVHSGILQLDIADTTGCYPFPAMTEQAIADADAFVLVFSVGDEQSFQHVSATRDLIFQVKGDSITNGNIPIVVVGNKLDLDDRCLVEKTTMECIATIDWEHSYLETSAKNNYNVGEIFDELFVGFKIQANSTPCSKRKFMNLPRQHQVNGVMDRKCIIS